MKHNDITAIAMSGGVDSATAAHLLMESAGRVIGVSHYIWPDSACCAPAALERARGVCADLGIPYHVLDFSEDFSSEVVDDFVNSYRAGITPNPCIRCNERIRFSRFYRAVEALCRNEGYCGPEESPSFATGHYVRLHNTEDGFLLQRARDRSKDQSYMLYRLPRSILGNFTFPLGNLLKSEVMKKAEDFGFPVSEIGESQDICFINGPYTEFLSSRLGEDGTPGPGLIEDVNGRVLGSHRGYIQYTVGQRRGLGLGDGPWYVLALDPENNRVIAGREDELPVESCTVGEVIWHIDMPEKEIECAVMLRYNSPEVPCRVRILDDGRVMLILARPAPATPGQSAVFYRSDCIIGGGIIERRPIRS